MKTLSRKFSIPLKDLEKLLGKGKIIRLVGFDTTEPEVSNNWSDTSTITANLGFVTAKQKVDNIVFEVEG